MPRPALHPCHAHAAAAVRGLALALALAVGVAACGAGQSSPGPDTPAREEAQPMAGDEIRLSGTVRYVRLEGGCWAFQATDGKQYELRRGAAADVLTDGVTATLVVRPRDDMSICQMGPIVEVVRVESVSPR